ncbi:MAG: glycosyltransferase family 92 protein [Candidatus Auribacterota bacterium]|jgi:glycosyltransferase involved in cell wall biosynthesis|nr:glycosyltransferase family 92 protein [Candidatus Auribacterota bacterium]
MENYLSVGAIFKNESLYLEEWLIFHQLQGVEKFYLYNNGSDDRYMDILEKYIGNATVELFDWPQQPGQLSAYKDCLQRTRHRSRWVAFIDLDEFLFSTECLLSEFLPRFETYPALAVNWLIYGSNGHKNEPNGNVVDAYLRRAEYDFVVNRHVKCVVDPLRTVDVLNPHCFTYAQSNAVNELLKTVSGPLNDYCGTQVRINHYFCKSQEYFEGKIARGRATTNSKRNWRNFNGHDRNEVFDDTASRVFHSFRQHSGLITKLPAQ